MPIIYLLRHAQSVANTKGILAGQDDSVELSKAGFKQAESLISYLSGIKFSKVYSSPLTRCIQTIAPFMEKNSKIDFQVDNRVIEMNYGKWSGRKLAVLSKDPKWKNVQNNPAAFTFPQGESFKSMRKRVDLALADLKTKKGPILVVTHGDIIKMAITSSLGLPINRFQSFVVEPASLTIINLEKSGTTILQSNFKVSQTVISKFNSNLLGGGNILTGGRWWRR
ncbi:MAG: histidine phosphatase family protein [Actinobacteria bacterium]|nr:histidine phosphatase family protein [Actinomycetota bacterium]